jgi:uncharacterized protein DUF1707
MTVDPARRELRASDRDREAIAEILRDAAADGRLTMEELDERLTAAYSARTYGDFEPLIRDLPVGPLPAVRTEEDVLQLSAPFSDVRRDGRWVVPARIVATAGVGNVKLDFTDAVVRGREVLVEATAYAGDVVLVVPDGFEVDLTGVQAAGLGSVRNKVRSMGSGGPRIRVVGRSVLGDVVARHPRRSRFLPH